MGFPPVRFLCIVTTRDARRFERDEPGTADFMVSGAKVTRAAALSVAERKRALVDAADEARGCRRCDLWRAATQTVFGEGRAAADAMLVGEQPGDAEDRAGHPFVGPAGRLLRASLAEAGLDERRLFFTNAVKHFKWRPRGTRRIHDTPTWSEIRACDHWLSLELALVRPRLVVCLGATAAQALFGRAARVGALRGRVVEDTDFGLPAVVTVHPAAILRGEERRDQMRREFVSDLELVRHALGDGGRRRVSGPSARVPNNATDTARKGVDMPPRGVKKGTKRARQYEHIKESLRERGESENTAEEIAARTVNKERAQSGEARESSRLSRTDISSGRRGGLRSGRKGPRGRTKDQLYEEARHLGIAGRSKMTKAQLERAVSRRRSS
jgi:uracil-DNA glycosylase